MKFRILKALLEMATSQHSISNQLQTIIERISTMSEALDKIKAYAAQIDAATDLIAARIQTLIDQISTGTVSPAEITAALQPEVDRLTALGKDTTNAG